MASNSAIPPPIPEVLTDLKFDRGVRVSWTPVKHRIINSLKTQGLVGYTDGTVPKPSPPATSPTQAVPAVLVATAVFSTTPSLEEWIFRNNWAKGIIESHVDNLPSLIANFDNKSAKELFDAFKSTYGGKDGMQKVLTMCKLCSCVFTGSDSIDMFFKCLWDLRKESVEAGNAIDDPTFHDIILAAFPSSFWHHHPEHHLDTYIISYLGSHDPTDFVPVLKDREQGQFSSGRWPYLPGSCCSNGKDRGFGETGSIKKFKGYMWKLRSTQSYQRKVLEKGGWEWRSLSCLVEG